MNDHNLEFRDIALKKTTKIKDLYVTDISFDVAEEDLRKLFSVCGTVRSIHMMNDAKTGQFTGRAYVSMANEKESRDAINTLDGALLINRCISVCASRPKETTGPAVEEARDKRRRPQSKGRRR